VLLVQMAALLRKAATLPGVQSEGSALMHCKYPKTVLYRLVLKYNASCYCIVAKKVSKQQRAKPYG
jgi:hypothetical protein